MLKVVKHEETGDAEITHDDESLQGNYIGMRLEDDAGLDLMAKLVDFYEAKGYKPMMMLNAADQAQRSAKPKILKRLLNFIKGA